MGSSAFLFVVFVAVGIWIFVTLRKHAEQIEGIGRLLGEMQRRLSFTTLDWRGGDLSLEVLLNNPSLAGIKFGMTSEQIGTVMLGGKGMQYIPGPPAAYTGSFTWVGFDWGLNLNFSGNRLVEAFILRVEEATAIHEEEAALSALTQEMGKPFSRRIISSDEARVEAGRKGISDQRTMDAFARLTPRSTSEWLWPVAGLLIQVTLRRTESGVDLRIRGDDYPPSFAQATDRRSGER